MAGFFDGAVYIECGSHPTWFPIDNDFCILLLLRDESDDQSSYFAQWGNPTAQRNIDIGTAGGSYPKSCRMRYRGSDITLSGSIPNAEEWVAFCADNDGVGTGGTYTFRCLRLSTGVEAVGSQTITLADRPDQTYPVSLGIRNTASPIELIGTYGLCLVLNRQIEPWQFRQWAYRPIETMRLFRQDDILLDIRPGTTNTATGLHVDFSGQNNHGTKLGLGTLSYVDGPPVSMQDRMLSAATPISGVIPPVERVSTLALMGVG